MIYHIYGEFGGGFLPLCNEIEPPKYILLLFTYRAKWRRAFCVLGMTPCVLCGTTTSAPIQ